MFVFNEKESEIESITTSLKARKKQKEKQ